jgi:hypothetical protein
MSAAIQREIDLRVEEINTKIAELQVLANANDINFYLSSIDKEFYCDKHIKDDDYLSDYHSQDGRGAWLSSSDFC